MTTNIPAYDCDPNLVVPIVFSDFSLQYLPLGPRLRFHTFGLGKNPISLRLARLDPTADRTAAPSPSDQDPPADPSQSTHIIMVRDSFGEQFFYPAEAIIRGLISGDAEFEAPLPDRLPTPLAFSALKGKQYRALCNWFEGAALTELHATAGGVEEFDEVVAIASGTGLRLLSVKALSALITNIKADYEASMAQMFPPTDRTPKPVAARAAALASTASSASSPAPTHNPFAMPSSTASPTAPAYSLEQISDPTTRPKYGAIVKLDEETIARFEQRRAHAAMPYRKWPFNALDVYETVVIAPADAVKARNAVNTYSARTGRKFATRRLADGSMQVTRIQDRAPKPAQKPATAHTLAPSSANNIADLDDDFANDE